MPVWMLCLPVLFPILAGAVMLARPIEDRKKRQIYVAGAVIVNAVLALTVLIWTPDGGSDAAALFRYHANCAADRRSGPGIWYFGVAFVAVDYLLFL